jgi:hypothetical protein
MHGILGGLLGVMNALGALLLACFIGWTPATKNNRTAGWARLVLGSLLFGLIVGMVVDFYFLASFLEYWEYKLSPNEFFALQLVFPPLLMLGITGITSILESLRQSIEQQSPES